MKNKLLVLGCLLFFCLKIDAQKIEFKAFYSKGIGSYFQLVKDSVPADTILITGGRGNIIDYCFDNDSTLNFIYQSSGFILYSEANRIDSEWEFAFIYQLGSTGLAEGVYDPKRKIASNFKFKDSSTISYQFDGETKEIEINHIREFKRSQRKKANKIYADHLKSKINDQDE